MRQIVLDTETTGIGVGHRIIEIGCVELIDRRLTGNHFHCYLNPERDVDPGAFRVHGLSRNFLQDKPLFAAVARDLLAFVEGSEVIIHNAPFDTGFLEAELTRINWPRAFRTHCSVLDTLVLAKEKYPGQRNNLDALCKRLAIDNSKRALHGALLDAEILAAVYLAMTGGQISMFNDEADKVHHTLRQSVNEAGESLSCESVIVEPTEEECLRHEAMVARLKKQSGVDLWYS